jgi:hypothetical protein
MNWAAAVWERVIKNSELRIMNWAAVSKRKGLEWVIGGTCDGIAESERGQTGLTGFTGLWEWGVAGGPMCFFVD